ncbi:MAG: hypothetical protein V2I57_02805 [Xanthomonadales bacterium]|jgi:hypothetical protein|nr:hypothetical protein [Xanthomonadales bacterium]
MEWLRDIFHAIVQAGLPLMALTFAVIWWALHRGRLQGESVGELQKSIEALAARQKSDRKKKKTEKNSRAGQSDHAGLQGLDDDLSAMEGDLDPDLEPDGESGEKLDPVLEKWFSFGGGFYGLVAFYTWIIIEWDEVWGFVSDLPGIVFSFDIGALISLAINFFIESLMNFITAIAWPIYWLGVAGNPWLWIGVAYGGYWLGIKAAQQASGKRWPGEGSSLTETNAGSTEDDSERS